MKEGLPVPTGYLIAVEFFFSPTKYLLSQYSLEHDQKGLERIYKIYHYYYFFFF